MNTHAIEIELGTHETDFEIEPAYRADEIGMLCLQHNNACNQLCLEVIYPGNTPNGLEKIADKVVGDDYTNHRKKYASGDMLAGKIMIGYRKTYNSDEGQ